MKNTFIIGSMLCTILFTACNNSTKPDTHEHEDGSTHTDHDTTKPVQQEFIVGDSTHKDSSGKEHTHKDGENHPH